MKRTLLVAVALLACTAIGILSCKKDIAHTPASQQMTSPAAGATKKTTKATAINACGAPTVVSLIAGQQYTAGTVSVYNDATTLYVTYTTTGGWSISELHLYVGDCALIPTNGPGNPVPGRFPLSYTGRGVTTYTFSVPLSSVGNCFCVAAHAVVSGPAGTQTAWGAGTRFVQKGNWGTYFNACKQTCNTCLIPANVLFGGESAWPNGRTTVTIGGYTYTQSQVSSVYYQPDNDAKAALLLLTTLKVSNPSGVPANIQADATVVENWLATLGQYDGTTVYTAPASVQTALQELQTWEVNNTCQQ